VADAADEAIIEVLSLRDGSRKRIIQSGTYGRYTKGGDLLYMDRGTLFAVPFDLDRLQVVGTPTRVVDGVAYSPTFGFAHVDIAENGTLVYRRDSGSDLTQPAWIDATGRVEHLALEPGHYEWPRLSPSGRKLALARLDDSDYDIMIYDTESRLITRLTNGGGYEGTPVWTPADEALLYASMNGAILWQPSDSSGRAQALMSGDVRVPWSFSPDGRRLAFYALSPTTGFDLWTVPIEHGPGTPQTGKPDQYFATDVYETYASFSPDGRWIAYGSNESGIWEVYVRAFPDNGRAVRVSPNGEHVVALLSTSSAHDAGRDHVTVLLNALRPLRSGEAD